LIVAARKVGLGADRLAARHPRLGEVPFSSDRKLMSTVHADTERGDRLLVFSKGAPDVLLARCTQELVGDTARPLTDDRRADIRSANEALAAQALRTLAIACRSLPPDSFTEAEIDDRVERDLVFGAASFSWARRQLPRHCLPSTPRYRADSSTEPEPCAMRRRWPSRPCLSRRSSMRFGGAGYREPTTFSLGRYVSVPRRGRDVRIRLTWGIAHESARGRAQVGTNSRVQ
jgi:hypothetical protein